MTVDDLRARAQRLRPGGASTMPMVQARAMAVGVGIAALLAGLAVLSAGWVEPLVSSDPAVGDEPFSTLEVIVWSVLALFTGGIAFGGHTRRPPVLAAGLVGSAALLGADPVQCATIAVVGVVGGLRSSRAHMTLRLAAGGLLAWSLPGVLALANVREVALGELAVSLNAVLALWLFLAVVIPLVESLGTRLVLEPVERVDPVHMLVERFEPQSILAALAALAAAIYSTDIGWAAGLVVLLPAAAARVGFAKHDEGRRAVSQTLAAMTALPEWVGIIDPGHTARVRGVAERVAVDMGLESRVRGDIVRTAELHELGHLEGGAVTDDRGRIARSGAAVLEQAGMQGRVVRILDATDPDRVMQSPDPDVELGAAIVAAACELDRMGPIPDVGEAATRVKVALGKAHRSAADYL